MRSKENLVDPLTQILFREQNLHTSRRMGFERKNFQIKTMYEDTTI